MRRQPAELAAELLIKLKTKAGCTVPKYAKLVVEGFGSKAERQRAAPELFKFLSQMRASERATLLQDPTAALWYALYGTRQALEDTDVFPLTGRTDQDVPAGIAV